MDVGAPLGTSNATNGVPLRSNFPVPFLPAFGVLAGILGLIVFALLIFADNNSEDNQDSDIDIEKPAKSPLPPAESEPKIVVIMAGNTEPTYLANPVIFCSLEYA